MAQWPKASTTCIIVGGEPLEFEMEASAALYPGDCVIFTGANTIGPAGADAIDAIGFAVITPNLNLTTGALEGGKRDQAFASGNAVKVVKGDVFIMARLAPAQTITRGEMLQPADSGELKAYECGTDNACQLVAQAFEAVTSVTLFQWILVNVRIN